MKILVTGGAGYIGSHVVNELNKHDHEVTVVDDLTNGSRQNLFAKNRFIQGKIQDEKILDQIAQDAPEAIFHFSAWKAAGESMTNPEKYMLNNINGTLPLLARMHDFGCRYFIFSSSAAVYGEPDYLPIDENHKLSPQNYYGYTKLCIEENLAWLEKLRGIKYAALRYFNAAGYDPEGKITGIEKSTANLLPVIMEVAAGLRDKYYIFGDDYDTPDGSCIRDYIHVTDLARAHVLALDYIIQQQQSLVVNLGSETGHSVLEISDMAEKIVGKKIPHQLMGKRDGDTSTLYATAAKARQLLGWEPQWSDPHTIIKTMWDVYKNYKQD